MNQNITIHDVEQGTSAWKALRLEYFTASDASAMMGESKYKSRPQLLHEKKTGKVPAVNDFQQALFDRGHAAEASARNILEMEMLEDLAPAVVSCEIDGLKLLASLDGMNDDKDLLFEHKLWNETLAKNVVNEVLTPAHYWQLEHQCLVTGIERVLFVVSDGTSDKRESFYYQSEPLLREELLLGWKQFAEDLAAYVPEAKEEVVVGSEAESFPMITYEVNGTDIVSNIAMVLPVISERAEIEINRTLETDQDFADKELLNKAVKTARDRLKDVVSNVQGEFVSFKEFAEVASKVDAVLQKMQSHGEKQVKDAKEQKKNKVVSAGSAKVNQYAAECEAKIRPLLLQSVGVSVAPDFINAIKGKRTIDSITDAVEGVVVQAKIAIDKAMALIVPNQIYLNEHAKDYKFLFADYNQLVNQETEPFQAIVKSRIAAHVEAERIKKEAAEAEAANAKPVEEPAPAPTVTEEVPAAKPLEPEAAANDGGGCDGPDKDWEERLFKDDMIDWAKRNKISKKAQTELDAIMTAFVKKVRG